MKVILSLIIFIGFITATGFSQESEGSENKKHTVPARLHHI